MHVRGCHKLVIKSLILLHNQLKLTATQQTKFNTDDYTASLQQLMIKRTHIDNKQ